MVVSGLASRMVAHNPSLMMSTQLSAFSGILRQKKATLIGCWEASVRALPGAAELDGPALLDHIPQFVDELIAAVARHDEEVSPGGKGSPVEHGIQRLAAGFDIKEVVIEYNILRAAVHDVAEESGVLLGADDWRVINHIIDDAIAWAVDTFSREQSAELHRRRNEYLAFVMHDVRTPLNAISLTADLLSGELGSDTQCSDMLRVMQRNVGRIDRLIRRVIEEKAEPDSSEGLVPVRREIDLWPLVHRLLQDLQPVAEAAKVRIGNVVPRHLTATADANLIARTLQNLIGNAVKFAPGGEIEVGAKPVENGVECWVRDNGPGIPPERLKRIFEKGETDADPARAGYGLGLAISKKIVESHGGEIFIESQPGHGAEFRFSIPEPSM